MPCKLHMLMFSTTAMAVALVGVMPVAAQAQQTSAESGTQDIVVTAQRVESLESKTPISMETLTGKALARNGVADFQILAEQDPSLNFDAGNGAGFVTLRGISGNSGVGPAVPIATDGFYTVNNFTFNNSLYDINRVEVLRGPQGTLFGRNTSGGLVNVVTNDPGKTLGGEATLTLGNYNQVEMQAALNIPVTDRLQIRAAFFSAKHDGYRQIAGGGVADDEDAVSGRIKVAAEPVDGLKLLLTYQITHVGGAGTADNIMNLPADPNSSPAAPLPTHQAIPLTRTMATIYNVAFASQINLTEHLYQMKLSYDRLPFGITATYLGGYDHVDYMHSTPTTGLDSVVYGIPNTIELLSNAYPDTQNHEFRLTSAPNQPITWQAGAFYFYSTNLNTTHYRDITTPQAPDIVQFPYYNMQRSVAGYGQADWHSGRNSFSAGIRYTADTIAQTDLASPGDGIYPARQSDSYSKWTWHVGDEFQFNTHSMAYIKADTGYRAGFFNLVVPVTGPSTIQPYAPEYVTSFEAGTKNRLMRGHLKLDADIFYMRYNGEQLLQSNQGGVITVNAAQTNIYGAEVSFAEQIEPLGEFDLNLNWLHARFGHQLFTNAVGQTYDIGGNRLTQAPDVSLTAAYEHVFKLKSGSVTARVQTKYQSGQYFDFYNVPDSYQKAYTRTDAHLTYQTQDGRWSIGAFVRNIENSLVIVDESESFAPPLSNPGTYNVGFQAPRTYGIQIGAKW